MWKFTDVNYRHLATFRSEWIGVQYYYFCTMKIDNRTIRYSIMFDGDDLAEAYEGEDFDKEEVFAEDLAWCNAEVLASQPSMSEIIKSANKSIQEYNNGARFQIADNYDMEDMAQEVKDIIGEDAINELKSAEIDYDSDLYQQIDGICTDWCDERDLVYVDTCDVIELIK